jgi:hypothetical protein
MAILLKNGQFPLKKISVNVLDQHDVYDGTNIALSL